MSAIVFWLGTIFPGNQTVAIHEMAKLAAKDRAEVCYDVQEPQKIAGKYCLRSKNE